jgi:hypothetical protein
MPRLSLYKPERGLDYKFIDRQISEMFQAGGTDVYLHKYMGPKILDEGTADQPIYNAVKETNIQDLLFLENRDRKYDEEIYRIRGLYNVQNIDFNLSQFGLFIDNDTLFMTVHINDFIKYIGRKPLSGDVIELPHLKDQFALNDYDIALPRYYVIEDVGRASEGFSSTWFPHLYRLKLKKITDAQQFADILDKPAVDANGDPSNQTLRDLLSTHNKELEINDSVIRQAEVDAPKSGYETRQFYTLAVDPNTGKAILETADETSLDASNVSNTNISSNNAIPARSGYTGYLVGDGFPVNGYDFGHGIQFPIQAVKDDFFLRTDFLPSRLFRFEGSRWIKVEDAVRMTMTNDDQRQTLKTSFINNREYIYNDLVVSDYVNIAANAHVIDTNIDYIADNLTNANFVALKFELKESGYPVEVVSTPANATLDYPNILSNHNEKVRITLPIINNIQQAVPKQGLWRVSLCANREPVRQSLSKALKPRADL